MNQSCPHCGETTPNNLRSVMSCIWPTAEVSETTARWQECSTCHHRWNEWHMFAPKRWLLTWRQNQRIRRQ